MLQADFHAPGENETHTFQLKRYEASEAKQYVQTVQFSFDILMDNKRHFQC